MGTIINPNLPPEMTNAHHVLLNETWLQLKKLKRTAANVRDKAASNFGRLEALLLDGPAAATAEVYTEVAKSNIALHDEHIKWMTELHDFEKGFLAWFSKTKGDEEGIKLLTELLALRGVKKNV